MAVCFVLTDAGLWFWIIGLLLYLSSLALGSFAIGLNFYLQNINKLPSNQNQIAVTFDDGPTPLTLDVLKILAKWNARATFFCIGSAIETYPEILVKIHEEGHLIGNHTYSHKNWFPVLRIDDMISDVNKTTDLIQNLIHQRPILFRPPFGVTNPRIAKAVKNLGLKSIGWNKRSLDTVSKNNSAILKRVTKNLTSGDIILFHDNLPQAAENLDLFLAVATEKGFKCERLDNILNINAYEPAI